MKYSRLRPLIQIIFVALTALGLFTSPQIGWIIIFALLTGPIFCGWMCPFGALQDALVFLRRKLNLPTLKLRGHHQLKWLRYVLFIITLVNGSSLILQILSRDPRGNFQQFLQVKELTILNGIILTLFLLAALFSDRFFCKYLCIEGAKQSIISGGRLFKIQRNDACVNCNRCDGACPMGINITKKPVVHDAECIGCLACIDACPVQGAIQMKPAFSWKRLASSIVIIVLLVMPLVLDTIDASKTTAAADYSITQSVTPEVVITQEVVAAPEASTTESSESPVQIIETTPSVDESTKVNENAELTVTEPQVETEILEGSAKGYKGTITVQVQKTGDTIDSITVLSQREDRRWFNQAVSVIQEMLDGQTTDVDTVSGATYSSRGIINATKDALGLPPIN
ncbi:MAG: FMN-binding protein [Clostridia bacterium]|nr:FMN-binding protein [Clostridia bacterium]